MDRTKVPYKTLKRILRKSSNSRIQEFSVKKEQSSLKIKQLTELVHLLGFFPSLHTLRSKLDYSGMSSFKLKTSKSFEHAFCRLQSIRKLFFNYNPNSIPGELIIAFGIIFGKLKRLEEVHPRAMFMTDKDVEVQFFKHFSQSPSLKLLNIEVEKIHDKNVEPLADYLAKLKTLSTLNISLLCQNVIATEKPFWSSLMSLRRIVDLDLEVRFFRTAIIPETFISNFKNITELKKLRKLVITFGEKRNNQSLNEIWETLKGFRDLVRFELDLKDFKLQKEDYQSVGDMLADFKELKELKLTFRKMAFHIEKEFYDELKRGISDDEKRRKLEKLSLRFAIDSNEALPKGIFFGNFLKLKQFEYEGQIQKGNCHELGKFLQDNSEALEHLIIKFRNTKKPTRSYHMKEEHHILDGKSLEELFGTIKAMEALERLELVLGEYKRNKKEEAKKPGSHGDPIYDLLEGCMKLRDAKLDFARDIVSEVELKKIMSLFERRAYRNVEIKGDFQLLTHTFSTLVEKFNKKYGNVKDPKKVAYERVIKSLYRR